MNCSLFCISRGAGKSNNKQANTNISRGKDVHKCPHRLASLLPQIPAIQMAQREYARRHERPRLESYMPKAAAPFISKRSLLFQVSFSTNVATPSWGYLSHLCLANLPVLLFLGRPCWLLFRYQNYTADAL